MGTPAGLGKREDIEGMDEKSYPCLSVTSPTSAKWASILGSWLFAENEIKIPLLDRKLIRAEHSRQEHKLDSLFHP